MRSILSLANRIKPISWIVNDSSHNKQWGMCTASLHQANLGNQSCFLDVDLFVVEKSVAFFPSVA